jgi:hypothetical protein
VITFPTKKPRCPVCGKVCKVVDRIDCSTSHDELGSYMTEAITIVCKTDGQFHMWKEATA